MLQVLLTNDDGIEAECLQTIRRALERLSGVRLAVIAPDGNRSAMARPIPVPPPVMRMRLPCRRSFVNITLPRKGINLTLLRGACQ